jgi:biopolymer transport protein ExbB
MCPQTLHQGLSDGADRQVSNHDIFCLCLTTQSCRRAHRPSRADQASAIDLPARACQRGMPAIGVWPQVAVLSLMLVFLGGPLPARAWQPVGQTEPGDAGATNRVDDAQLMTGPASPEVLTAATESSAPPPTINLSQLFRDGGTIGYLIVVLSLALLAMIFENALSLRAGVLARPGLADLVHQSVVRGDWAGAKSACRTQPCFLSHLLQAGLAEVELGYRAVEKAMEDAAQQHAARLHRKVDLLSVISTVAPMLGLMGTVWGMILAFMEFERKANPQVSELAPGVYKALVTTLFGLAVAIPAIAALAYFRNRVDELVARTALLAEQVFADYKRGVASSRSESAIPRRGSSSAVAAASASATSGGAIKPELGSVASSTPGATASRGKEPSSARDPGVLGMPPDSRESSR